MKIERDDGALTVPPAVMAEIEAAADAEKRSTSEVLQDAVRRYLHETQKMRPSSVGESIKKTNDVDLSTFIAESHHGRVTALEAAQRLLELRESIFVPEGMTLEGLIADGRK